AFRRLNQECLEVLRGPIGVAALQEQEREPIVRAGERGVELERAAVVADRLIDAAGLRETDGHVLQDARIVGMIAHREAVGREGGVVVALPLKREGLVEIIEALGFEIVARAAEQTAPETHAPKIACGLPRPQRSFPSHACRAALSRSALLAPRTPLTHRGATGGLAVLRGVVPRAGAQSV